MSEDEDVRDDGWIADPESVDPYEGGVRPGPPFTFDQLPPPKSRNGNSLFHVEFIAMNVDELPTLPMKAREARAYLELKISRLRCLLMRARIHPARDCWFDLPRNKEE